MLKTHRALVICLVLALASALPAAAEVFTVTMSNDTEFVTRYQPRQDPRDESQVMLLTQFGNWIALSKDEIVDIASETQARGFGTMLDTRTVLIGWAPNDRPVEGAEAADPTTQLLNFLRDQSSQSEQDFSVNQFVTTENAGMGGLPAAGVSSSGSSSFPVGFGGTTAVEPQTSDQ